MASCFFEGSKLFDLKELRIKKIRELWASPNLNIQRKCGEFSALTLMADILFRMGGRAFFFLLFRLDACLLSSETLSTARQLGLSLIRDTVFLCVSRRLFVEK